MLFGAFLYLWNLIVKKNKKFKTGLMTSFILLLLCSLRNNHKFWKAEKDERQHVNLLSLCSCISPLSSWYHTLFYVNIYITIIANIWHNLKIVVCILSVTLILCFPWCIVYFLPVFMVCFHDVLVVLLYQFQFYYI